MFARPHSFLWKLCECPSAYEIESLPLRYGEVQESGVASPALSPIPIIRHTGRCSSVILLVSYVDLNKTSV